MTRRSLAVTLALMAGLSSTALFGSAGAAAGQVTVKTAIQYAAPNNQPLVLDAYIPAGSGPFPVVVVVHGGGWQFGDRTNLADVARYLAENGLAAFSIDYRLANPRQNYSPYPAAVEDVKAAVRWVRSHAGQFNVSPGRIGLLGSSAGAHLAELVGMEGQGPLEQGDRVRAVVAWSGPADIAEIYRDAAHRAIVAVEKFSNCKLGLDGCTSLFKEMSPLTYVDSSDPPVFFANGTHELVPLLGPQEFDRALTAAKVQHQFVQVPGQLHAQHYKDMTSPMLPAGQTVQQASLAWLKKWLTASTVTSTPPPPTSPPAKGNGNGNGKGKGGMVALIVIVVAAVVVVIFATITIGRTLRKRARRAERIREWKNGQPRDSRSSSRSRSRSRSSSRTPSNRDR